ncbi:MAG: CU044_5270 family protein [Streptosporangiaceae bacterium]
MNDDAETIHQFFAEYDPAADVTRNVEKLRASMDLITELAPQPPARRRIAATVSRRRLILGGVVSLSAGTAAILGSEAVPHLGTPTMQPFTATPQLLSFRGGGQALSAREILTKAAASAERQPDLTGTGRYQYVETEGWYLDTTMSTKGAGSAVIPVLRRQWMAGDGSGRIVTRPGKPYFPLEASRLAWQSAGAGRPRPTDQTFGRGELQFMWRPGSLSSDPVVLRRQLEVGHAASLGPAETMVAVSDLYNEQAVGPAIRAAVMRLVSTLPGLRFDGTTTDRAGRRGIGVSIESDLSGLPTRYILIFDPDTGQLLDSEQVLTVSAGKLDVPIPSVIAYTVYLAAYRTER